MKKFLSLMIALTVVACGTDSQQSTPFAVETKTLTVDEGAFKLYENENVVPKSFCDLHVLLTLKNTDKGSVAVFENALAGICEIAVTPNQRTFMLNEVKSTCGSRVFEGTLINPVESEANTVVITDHRQRVCKDLVPASIVVEKRFSVAPAQTLFTIKNKVSPLKTFEGTLTRMMAIGGESTGYGLLLADGSLIEIELSTDLLPSFIEDQRVEIKGTFKTVRGIEIPVRQVLKVKTITAI